MRLLAMGGYFDASGECFIDHLDLERGTRGRLLSFIPPEPHRVPGKGFTGAAWLDDDTLLVCSFDAVWRIVPSTRRCTGRLHQTDFNDLHSVAVDLASAQIHVCNTGLDSVETFDPTGRFQGRIAMTPAWFEAVRQRGAAVSRDEFEHVLGAGWEPTPAPRLTSVVGSYYDQSDDEPFHRRKVRDYAHPNHVVIWGGRLVATLLARRELRCLRSHRTLARLEAPPHDGVLVGDDLWLTTVDGRVWRVSPGGDASLVLDTSTTGHLGWCRGLAIGENTIAVGLTAIRSQPQYAWRSAPYEHTETAVLWIEHLTGRLRACLRYDELDRHAKVCSLIPARGAWG
jgi:hypothetical protein